MRLAWRCGAILLAVGCSASDRREAQRSSNAMTEAVATSVDGGVADSGADLDFPADAQLAGRWIGPEGLYVEIVPEGGGRYDIAMQYDLNSSGTFPARRVGDTIEVERPDGRISLSYGAGAETGMKWVAPGAHCLIAKVGQEAYCRSGL